MLKAVPASFAALGLLAACGNQPKVSSARLRPPIENPPLDEFQLEPFAAMATGFFVSVNRIVRVELPEEPQLGSRGFIQGIPLSFDGKPLFFESIPVTFDGRQYVGEHVLKGSRGEGQLAVRIFDRGVNPFGERELRIFLSAGYPGGLASIDATFERQDARSAARRWGYETRAAAMAYLSQSHPLKKVCYLEPGSMNRQYPKALLTAVEQQDATCFTGLLSQMSGGSRRTALLAILKQSADSGLIAPIFFAAAEYLSLQELQESGLLERTLLEKRRVPRKVDSSIVGVKAPISILVEDSYRGLLDALLSWDLRISNFEAFQAGFIFAESQYTANRLIGVLERSLGTSYARDPEVLIALLNEVRSREGVSEPVAKLQALLKSGWKLDPADPVLVDLVLKSGHFGLFQALLSAGLDPRTLPQAATVAEGELRRLRAEYRQEKEVIQRERLASRIVSQGRIVERLKL